ncbi:MAG: hypothetical protein JKY48_05800 [Flavobacteriales bacterium]|nr:hypothetical protein [Flavobacteriales bacterium]
MEKKPTIYLNNDLAIKIIETEENFERTNSDLDYNELNEVFKESIYVFDWKMDQGKIIRSGKRNMSEMSCSTFELVEPILEQVQELIPD